MRSAELRATFSRRVHKSSRVVILSAVKIYYLNGCAYPPLYTPPLSVNGYASATVNVIHNKPVTV